MDKLLDKLHEHFGEYIRLEPGLSVEANALANLFAGASWTYESMMSVEQARGYGYAKYIEQWRNEGILPNE